MSTATGRSDGPSDAAPLTLWLVRHPPPLLARGICYGQLDVAADADRSLACAAQLATVLPANLAVVTSPLQRCEQLARQLHGLRPDLAYKTDARLKELDFGQWEGRQWADIARSEIDAWTENFAHHRAGDTGESVTQFMQRVASAFDALPDDRPILWITHAGVIRAAHLLAAGIRSVSQASEWPQVAPACGQWCALQLNLRRPAASALS